MLIVDTREKPQAIKSILETFDNMGVEYLRSKLIVGDYMIFKNPTVIVDRKQNIDEIAANCTRDHVRFRAELETAVNLGVELVVLVEQNRYKDRDRWITVKDISDLIYWQSEHSTIRGEQVFRVLASWCSKYPLRVEFCNKRDTGRRIMEILENGRG